MAYTFLNEEQEPREPEAWHIMKIKTYDDFVLVHETTNDNLDYGYPSEYAAWTLKYPDQESALTHTGKSRVGVSGVRVFVYLDGKQI